MKIVIAIAALMLAGCQSQQTPTVTTEDRSVVAPNTTPYPRRMKQSEAYAHCTSLAEKSSKTSNIFDTAYHVVYVTCMYTEGYDPEAK